MAAEKEDDSFEKIGETEEEKKRKKEKKKEKKTKDSTSKEASKPIEPPAAEAKGLRERCGDAETQLREGKPTAALEEATHVLALLTSATGVDALWARDVAVARLMSAVLTRADALSPENKSRAAQFLLSCVLYSVPLISEGPEPRDLLLQLHRVFNTAHPLYAVRRPDVTDPTLRRLFFGDESGAEANATDKWARVPRAGLFSDANALPSAATLYVSQVNAFGSAGGFDACLARLRMPVDKFWLGAARNTLKVLVAMKDALVSAKEGGTWLEAYLNDVQKVVFERLLVVTEEELSREDKVLFREVGAAVQHVLARVMGDDALDELVERFNLDMGIRALRSKAVERRARGIRHIRKIVQRALAKAEEKRSLTRLAAFVNHGGERKAGEPKPLDAAFLIKWLRDQSVVDLLLREEHPDVLRAGVVVLQFMAHANELDLSATISALWKLHVGKHESVKRVVLGALLDLAPYLPVRGIEILNDVVRAVPAPDLDTELLRFVRDLSRHVASRSPALTAKQWNGCAVLWTAVQDEATSAATAAAALQLLLSLLLSPVAAAQQRAYAEAALDNLLKGVAVPPSLELITRIVEAQPKRGQRKRSGAAPLLEALETRSKGLVRSVLKDLRNLRGGAMGKTRGTVAQRMSFLEAVLLNSALSIAPTELDDLWELCVTGREGSEAQAFFKWLEALAEGGSAESSLDEALIEHVFHKMCALDPATLDATAFSLFLRFFVRHNERSGKLKAERSVRGREGLCYFAVGGELTGAKNLWAVALDARDERVATAAGAALNSFYQLHPSAESLKPRATRLREEHIRTAVQLLSGALNGKTANALRAQRVIGVLNALVRDFARPAQPFTLLAGDASSTSISNSNSNNNTGSNGNSNANGSNNNNNNNGGTVTYLIRADTGSHFRLVMSAASDVAELRQRIAEAYGRPVALLRVALTDGPELSELCPDSSTPLCNAPLPAGSILSVRLDEPPSPLTESYLLGTKKEKEAGTWGLLKSEPKSEELKAVLVEVLQMGMRAMGLQGFESARLVALNASVTSPASSPTTTASAPSTAGPSAPSVAGAASAATLSSQSTPPTPTSSTSSLAPSGSSSNLAAGDNNAAHPLKLLSGPEAYSALTAALEGAESVARPAWALLRLVPPPEAQLAELRADWRRLISANTPQYLLLHRLGLLAHLAAEPAMPDRLIAAGATQAVLALLPPQEESAPSAPLLAVLFRLLTELLTRPAASPFERTVRPTVKEAGSVAPRVVALMWNALRADPQLAPQVMRAGLPLLVACVSADEAHMAAFFEFAPLPAFLRALLLVPERAARELAADGLLHLAQATQHARQRKDSRLTVKPLPFLVDALFASLASIAADHTLRSLCAELFSLTCRLMRLQRRANDFPAEAWGERFSQIVALVRERPVLEPGENTVGAEDHVLIGLLRVAAAALRGAPNLKGTGSCRALIEDVWREGLFALPTAERHGPQAPPKCKSRLARAAAFDLLAEAARGSSPNISGLAELVERQVEGLRALRDWTHQVGERERSLLGYVGLVNQGATCYMNALLQQLFLVPEFRAGLLRAPDRSDGAKDSLLFQLQVLFSNLHESARRAFDTIEFCGACRDPDGRPINTGQQMDANEFFNMLFDRLEAQLKGGPEERLLKELFGGTLASQLILRDCPHSSEREEPFFTLSLEVKNKKRLEECLDLYVQGENIDEYKCETCNERRNTLKRQCIRVLPRILLLHLKRFEFDLEAVRNVKLNDSLSFPTRLSLEPYTREGIARREAEEKGQAPPPEAAVQQEGYEYDLAGVVVHSGTADAGHYYSFIRERGPGGRWFEFNDSTVSPFAQERIPDECYGGTEEVMVPDRERGGQKKVLRPKANNAYILVYERANCRDALPPPAGAASVPQIVAPLPSAPAAGGAPSPVTNGAAPSPGLSPHGGHQRSRSREKKEKKHKKEEKKGEESAKKGDESARKEEKKEEKDKDGKEKERKHGHHSSADASVAAEGGAVVAAGGDDDSDKETKEASKEKEVARPVHFDLTVQVPSRIRTQVWERNKDYVAERRVFSPEFFAFAWTLVHLRPSDDAAHLRVVQLETRLTHEIIARTKDRNLLSAWLAHLARQYGASQAAARWFLTAQDLGRVRASLLMCPAEATRQAYVDICAPLFRVLAPLERGEYEKMAAVFNEPYEARDTEAAEDEDLAKRLTAASAGPAVRMLETLLHLLRCSLRRAPRQCAQLFLLLRHWALVGVEERAYLTKRNIFRLALDYYLGPPPAPPAAASTTSAGAASSTAVTSPAPVSSSAALAPVDPKRLLVAPYAYAPLAFSALFDLLSVLLRGSNLNTFAVRLMDDKEEVKRPKKDDSKEKDKDKDKEKEKEKEMHTAPPGQLLPTLDLSPSDAEFLTQRSLWARFVREDLNPDAVKEMIAFAVWENRPSSRFFLALAREGLTTLKISEMRQFLRVLVSVMSVKDSIAAQRAVESGNILLQALVDQKNSKETFEMLNDFLTRTQPERSEEFRVWVHKHKDQVSHTVRDVQAHLERLRFEAQRARENAS